MDTMTMARALAWARVAIGATMIVAPRIASRLWLGERPSTAATLLVRGLGARDVVIGAGQLSALDGDGDLDQWLDAGATADVADAAATLLAARGLSARTVAGTMVVALGAAAAARHLKNEIGTEVS